MTTEEILEIIGDQLPEAQLADGFEDAIVGIVDMACRPSVVCYDYERCVELLLEDSAMSEEEAREYLDFNTTGAYVGEHTPVFLHILRAPAMIDPTATGPRGTRP